MVLSSIGYIKSFYGIISVPCIVPILFPWWLLCTMPVAHGLVIGFTARVQRWFFKAQMDWSVFISEWKEAHLCTVTKMQNMRNLLGQVQWTCICTKPNITPHRCTSLTQIFVWMPGTLNDCLGNNMFEMSVLIYIINDICCQSPNKIKYSSCKHPLWHLFVVKLAREVIIKLQGYF